MFRSTILQLFIVLLISTPSINQGQTCEGNLGENIFTNGDFGSGSANVLQNDPQIAPGYIYETNPPPQDGKYTITNYTGFWNLFEGWISIRDNSADPQGYMMVVNASYEPGLFYSQEITGLCENTVYEFTADIINLLATGSNMIKPDVSFLLNGAEMYTTGEIPENETWQTYGFTFETYSGQNQLNLSLRNNAPGGLGNDLAIDNISFRPCGPEATIVPNNAQIICADNDPVILEAELLNNSYPDPVFQWQLSIDGGVSWNNIENAHETSYTHTNLMPGNYQYRYLVANGNVNLNNYKCRISSEVKEILVLPKYTYYSDTVCQGLSVDFGDTIYGTTGVYYDSLLNFLGCDSIIVLELTVMPGDDIYATHTLSNPPCAASNSATFYIDSVYNGYSPYYLNFDGYIYSISENINDLGEGVYYYEITDKYGCSYSDSIIIQPSGFFTINLGEDMAVELGQTVHLVPNASIDIDNYLWYPSHISNCSSNCTEVIFTPTQTMLSIRFLSRS